MDKSFFYYLSAEQGPAEAQFNLGRCYAKGEGVEKNREKRFHRYEQAAQQGDAEAQRDLAIRYAIGKGVEQNDERAFLWFEQAAKQGDADAQKYKKSYWWQRIKRFVGL